MTIFAVTYVYGDKVLAGDDDREDHVRFLRQMAARGTLLMSGPFDDERSGGMQIVRADSRQEVCNVFGQDPYVLRGVVTQIDVRQWRPVLGDLATHIPDT